MEYFIQKWIDIMVKFLTNNDEDDDWEPVDEFIYNNDDEIKYL